MIVETKFSPGDTVYRVERWHNEEVPRLCEQVVSSIRIVASESGHKVTYFLEGCEECQGNNAYEDTVFATREEAISYETRRLLGIVSELNRIGGVSDEQ